MAKTPSKKALLEGLQDQDSETYGKVSKILEVSEANKPLRLEILCQDPQTTRDGKSVCAKKREVKIQDLHQVTRCEPCQSRRLQLYRNERARARRAEAAAV